MGVSWTIVSFYLFLFHSLITNPILKVLIRKEIQRECHCQQGTRGMATQAMYDEDDGETRGMVRWGKQLKRCQHLLSCGMFFFVSFFYYYQHLFLGTNRHTHHQYPPRQCTHGRPCSLSLLFSLSRIQFCTGREIFGMTLTRTHQGCTQGTERCCIPSPPPSHFVWGGIFLALLLNTIVPPTLHLWGYFLCNKFIDCHCHCIWDRVPMPHCRHT